MLPPLPRVIQGLAGPITVERPAKIVTDGCEREGEWDPFRRRIRVLVSLPRRYAWAALIHELVHAAEKDAGYTLPETATVAVHDAIASGMLHLIEWIDARA